MCLPSSIVFLQATMRWWPSVGQAVRWLQLGTEERRNRVIEKEEWAGVSGAAGKASSLLQCSTALWPCSSPSFTMCSCFTTWRHLCPSTRSIKSPFGWERWVRRDAACYPATLKCINSFLEYFDIIIIIFEKLQLYLKPGDYWIILLCYYWRLYLLFTIIQIFSHPTPFFSSSVPISVSWRRLFSYFLF